MTIRVIYFAVRESSFFLIFNFINYSPNFNASFKFLERIFDLSTLYFGYRNKKFQFLRTTLIYKQACMYRYPYIFTSPSASTPLALCRTFQGHKSGELLAAVAACCCSDYKTAL